MASEAYWTQFMAFAVQQDLILLTTIIGEPLHAFRFSRYI